jgi:hypothetical protein
MSNRLDALARDRAGAGAPQPCHSPAHSPQLQTPASCTRNLAGCRLLRASAESNS